MLDAGRVAVVDRRIAGQLAQYPEVNAMLIDRLCERAQRLAVSQAISQLNGVDRRLLALFWQLAERWGKVVADGVSVTLPLPHRLIAELVGARRPTVSTALGQLADRGVLTATAERGCSTAIPSGSHGGGGPGDPRPPAAVCGPRAAALRGGAPQGGGAANRRVMTRDIPDVQGAARPGYSLDVSAPHSDTAPEFTLPALDLRMVARRAALPLALAAVGHRGAPPRRRPARRLRRRALPRRSRPTPPGSRSPRSPSSSPSPATSRCSGSSAAGRPRGSTCARAPRSRSAAPPPPGCSPRPAPAAPR